MNDFDKPPYHINEGWRQVLDRLRNKENSMGVITLTASSTFGNTGHAIARIRGRNRRYVFDREYIGKETIERRAEAEIVDEGLYETINVSDKGSCSDYYAIAYYHDELTKLRVIYTDAIRIAKELTDGRIFHNILRIQPFKMSEALTYNICKPREDELIAVGFNLTDAIDDCWKTLEGLSNSQIKYALSALKGRLASRGPQKDIKELAELISSLNNSEGASDEQYS